MCETWTPAVLSLMNRRRAICRFVNPSASSGRTSSSRLVRPTPAFAVARGAGRIGYESHEVTVDGLAAIEAALADATAGGRVPELTSIQRAVEKQRAIKDDDEVESLRRACAIADRALADLITEGGLRPGRTEREVGRDLDARMLGHGADGPSFETIVATGP